MYKFHVTLHARPAEAPLGRTLEIAGRTITHARSAAGGDRDLLSCELQKKRRGGSRQLSRLFIRAGWFLRVGVVIGRCRVASRRHAVRSRRAIIVRRHQRNVSGRGLRSIACHDRLARDGSHDAIDCAKPCSSTSRRFGNLPRRESPRRLRVACRSCGGYQSRKDSSNSFARSSSPAGRGESLVTRCCSSAPLANAGTSADVKPIAANPFGNFNSRISFSRRAASTSPASAALTSAMRAPKTSAGAQMSFGRRRACETEHGRRRQNHGNAVRHERMIVRVTGRVIVAHHTTDGIRPCRGTGGTPALPKPMPA